MVNSPIKSFCYNIIGMQQYPFNAVMNYELSSKPRTFVGLKIIKV